MKRTLKSTLFPGLAILLLGCSTERVSFNKGTGFKPPFTFKTPPSGQTSPGTGSADPSTSPSGSGTGTGTGSSSGGTGGSGTLGGGGGGSAARGAVCGGGGGGGGTTPAPCEPDNPFCQPNSPPSSGIGSGAGTGTGSGSGTGNASTACAGGNLLQLSQNFTFEDPLQVLGRSCDWGIDGNLQKQNGTVTARREQRLPIDLPANAVLCDLSIHFARQGSIEYDDHMFFAIDNSVLMATRKELTDFLPTGANGLKTYDWEALKGKPLGPNYPSAHNPYCVSGVQTCQLPITQIAGDLELQVDSGIVQSSLACGSVREFLWVVTGDDNDGNSDQVDCRHSPISFTANFKYVLQ